MPSIGMFAAAPFSCQSQVFFRLSSHTHTQTQDKAPVDHPKPTEPQVSLANPSVALCLLSISNLTAHVLFEMAKLLDKLPAAMQTTSMKRLAAFFAYLHHATLQVPQHHTHHIGRIVQPQIRSWSDALCGHAARSSMQKKAKIVSKSLAR